MISYQSLLLSTIVLNDIPYSVCAKPDYSYVLYQYRRSIPTHFLVKFYYIFPIVYVLNQTTATYKYAAGVAHEV